MLHLLYLFNFIFLMYVFFFIVAFMIVLLTLNLDDIAWGFTLSFFERFRICLYKYLLIDLLVNDIIFRIDVVIIIFRFKKWIFYRKKKKLYRTIFYLEIIKLINCSYRTNKVRYSKYNIKLWYTNIKFSNKWMTNNIYSKE